MVCCEKVCDEKTRTCPERPLCEYQMFGDNVASRPSSTFVEETGGVMVVQGGREYKLFFEFLNHQQAQVACASDFGGQLASFPDRAMYYSALEALGSAPTSPPERRRRFGRRALRGATSPRVHSGPP